MNTAILLDNLSRDKLPQTATNPGRLFESLSTPGRRLPHSLPDEILSFVFLTATHQFHDRFESILTPIMISHVCSRWREVAISTRGLWTSLILTFPTCRSQLSRTITWLSRSYPYPIDIFLDFRDPSWNWEEDSHAFHLQDMEAVLRLLLTHVRRWRHFELLTDTWAPIFTFLWYTRRVEAAPLLRSLSLSRCNAYLASKGAVFHPIRLRDPIPLFGGLALDALRDVSLSGVHVDWARSSLRNLTRLEFKYHASGVMPSLDQFFDIMSGCSNLRHLSIIGWGPQFEKLAAEGNTQENWDPTTKARRIIQLRHLVNFSFGFIDVNYAVKVLSLFSFPSIENLTLEDVSFTLNPLEYQDATPILDWLTPRDDSESSDACITTPRTVCGIPLDGIVSLQLYSIHASDSVFSCFFSAFPGLQKLGLFDVTDLALQTLYPSSDPDFHHPCPVLRELECRNVDSTTLVDVVRSRATIESILPLESISFDSNDPLRQLTHADRLKLNDAGIKVMSSTTETF
jgi:F-box-like